MQAEDRRIVPLPAHERHFYSTHRAFGRFGIRSFDPVLMTAPHWHGHIEINYPAGFDMDYLIDGQVLTVPANRTVVFWAGVPHQLVGIHPDSDQPKGRLTNIYLPLDAFLAMKHITPLQASLLAGGLVILPETLAGPGVLQQWYRDYRTGDFERSEVVKMELNAIFRRASLEGLSYLRAPDHFIDSDRSLSSTHIRHVIAMVRFVLENLERTLRNADITAVTGLHENYAQLLFTQIMQIPLKQFVLRMRLVRARALLVESSIAIITIAQSSGFSSLSQFYAHFRSHYGTSPAEMRRSYLRMQFGIPPASA